MRSAFGIEHSFSKSMTSVATKAGKKAGVLHPWSLASKATGDWVPKDTYVSSGTWALKPATRQVKPGTSPTGLRGRTFHGGLTGKGAAVVGTGGAGAGAAGTHRRKKS